MILRCVSWSLLISLGVLVLGCNKGPVPADSELAAPTAAAVRESVRAGDDQPIIAVTPRAAECIHQIVTGQGIPNPCYLRVRVVPGGCCGFLHKLDLDPVVSSEDHTFESGGVKVVVLKRQVEMLRGSRVDYGQEGDQLGFQIRSPNFEGEALKKWLPVLEKAKRAE